MNLASGIDHTETTLHQIERREDLARKVLAEIQLENIKEPRHGPTFTPVQAAELVHRSVSAIRMAELDGRLPEQKRNERGRREPYTLQQIDHMRTVFGTRPWRNPLDEPIILPVQNFKGGVGKSTISVHLAQYLAIHGYRVLLIDADAQASTTMMFGYIPDRDLDADDTIYPALCKWDEELHRPLAELVRKTHYHGLDLVPSNLHLYNAEYEVAGALKEFGPTVLTGLRDEIATIADNYDAVIIDPPPALGMVSMSALIAASALLIPMPPNVIDFASTTAFLSMLAQNMQKMAAQGIDVDYGFIQIVLSRCDETKWAQQEITELAQTVFKQTVMQTEIKNSAEIDNATARQQSVYDMAKTTTNYQVRKRCLTQLNALNGEVEAYMRALWPNTGAIS